MVVRVVLTLVYAAVGLFVAFPLSYWFQDGIYHEMTWSEYVQSGPQILMAAAQFGAYDIYRHTAIGSIVGAIIIGRLLEWRIAKR